MQGIEETDIAMDQGKEFVISLWHNWQGPAAEALARVVADYEARHPNVRLELIYQESLVEALDTAVAAGEGPDLFITTQDQLGRFADSQTITPLSDQFDTTYLTANFIPATVDAVTWQEQVWGLPLMEEGIALVYNPALIDSSLIPEDKTDFAGLLNSAQSFHAAHPESYLFCNESLSATSLDAYHSAPIFFGFGGAEEAGYIDDWGTVHINTPERQAAAEWLQSLQPVIPAEVGYEICLDGLQSGEFAAWWTGPWSLEALQNAGVAYKIQGFGRPYVHVTSLFMGADAVSRQHDAPAAEFMEFWADPGVQTSLALAAGSPPASLLALQSAEVQANPEIAAYGAALADGIPFPSTPYANTQWDPLAQATAAILSGSQPPATALAEAQTAVEQAVAEMTQP
ncbi:MAG: extracellular solute-binding protein [Anaerolineales bacterium]|nr:extracellular solute-binding protein [Anaerolineales bacterium]